MKQYIGISRDHSGSMSSLARHAMAPGDHGNFDVFIQSTSTNRNLVAGTEVMYWENVGL